MLKRTWIKFLATVSVSGALAKAIGDSFIKIDELAKRIEELEAKNENLADLAWEQRTETYEYRYKLQKMHRRAQRAESARHHAIVDAAQPYLRERDEWKYIANKWENQANRSENYLRRIYHHLHFAWLCYMEANHKNILKANDVATLEANLRQDYRAIEVPPLPEKWSNGQ